MQHHNTHNYLMYFKSKQVIDSTFQSSMNLSEDRAPLGAFAWPPRSYTCSFCRRQFRSAQALGGHMNVHRHDRARLKQSSIPQVSQNNEILVHQDPNASQTPTKRFLDVKINPSCEGIARKVTNPTFNDDKIGRRVDLSVGIDLIGETTSCKRLKKTYVGPLPFLHGKRVCSSDGYGRTIGSVNEDVDLELRLGDPQTVR